MVESFIVSIVANLATEAGRLAFFALMKDDSMYGRIQVAYENALKQWTRNKQIINTERVWSRKRFEELLNLILYPQSYPTIGNGTLELLRLFEIELQKDIPLWNHIQGTAFKELIIRQNNTTALLQHLVDELQANKIDELELLARAENLVKFPIDKNIASGKYIPDTFLEVSELKDHVRYFVAPFLFYNKLLYEVSRFNFDDLHRHQTLNGGALFEFNASDDRFKLEHTTTDVFSTSTELYNYLNKKEEELQGDSAYWAFSTKLRRKKEDLEFLNSRILLLTAKAGQGKTTFLSDFARRVLLSREIPCLYLNAFEIDENDIPKSFSKKLYNFHEYSFRDVLSGFSDHCHSLKVPLVIIIDGLNENQNPQLFCRNLETFIGELLAYDFVKVILTCRDEYYTHNYSNLVKAYPAIKHVHINYHLDERHNERLICNYLSYFNIQTQLSENVAHELSKSFILLRIFAEAYQNQKIPQISTLYKDEIFQAYYEKQCSSVQEKLAKKDGLNIHNKVQVKTFVCGIVEYMYNNKIFNNIALNEILTKLSNDAEVFSRFLDENILLRRDLLNTPSVFGSEVVNFTYDEFRDFLIAQYLIEVIYVRSFDEFKKFVSEYTTTEQSRIAEGIRSFLFLLTKKHKSKELHLYLASLEWYNDTFLNLIWEMQEEYVYDTDINRIKELFTPDNARLIISNLVYLGHRDKLRYSKLNIHLLFEVLNSLDDKGLHNCLHSNFAYNHGDYYYGSRAGKADIDHLIDQLEELLEDEKFPQNAEIHNLYHFLLYFLPVSSEANYVYRAYANLIGSWGQANELYERCNSCELKWQINQMLGRYEV